MTEQDKIEGNGTPKETAEAIAPEQLQPAQADTESAAEPKAEIKAEAKAAPRLPEENAPRGEKRPAGASARRRRRSPGIPVQLTAILLVVTLVFGVVAGYALGRSASEKRVKELTAQLEELTASSAAQNDEAAVPTDDASGEENQQALADLSGEALQSDNDAVSDLVGEDDLLSGESSVSEAAPVVVAEFDGGSLMSDEVRAEYNEQLTTYIFAGYSEADISDTLLTEVLHYMVSDKVLEKHAQDMGLYELTTADYAQIETEAQQNYDSQVEFYKNYVREDGMSADDLTAAAKSYLETNEGITYETTYADLESSWWAQKLYNEVTKTASVSSEDILASYNTKLAEQKENFEAYPEEYEYAQQSGELILYNLPGYRAVRMILLPFADSYMPDTVSELNDEIAALDTATDAAQIAAYQAELDADYQSVEAQAQAVLDELNGGADFDELIDRYGGDDGMRNAALRATGYYISESSVLWPAELIQAVMQLQTVGDVSGVVRVPQGACILKYIGDVTAGDVAIDNVYDELQSETLENAKYDVYEAQVNTWLEEANAVYYPERMQ